MKTILQIIPAEGWLAVYLHTEAPWYYTVRLACWALVRELSVPDPVVVGLMAGGDGVEEADDAYCYIHERDVTPALQAEWAATGEAEPARRAAVLAWRDEYDRKQASRT